MALLSWYGWFCTGLAVIVMSVLVSSVARNPFRSDALFITVLLLASSVYDNLLVGWGAFIGEGELLTILSYVRWFVHWALVPFLVVVGARVARNAGFSLAQLPLAMLLAYAVSTVLAIIDVSEGFMPPVGLQFEPVIFQGTLRLVSVDEVLPIITIIVNVFVLIVYAVLWSRTGEKFPFFGSLAAFIGNAVPASMAGTLPGAAGEALLFFGTLTSNYIAPDKKQADEQIPLLG